jgi:hypothetical protein
MGNKLLMSTVFHPQTDGATEQANHSIRQILRTVVSNDQKDWAEKFPMVEFALNSSISATTGFAPFELNHGYVPIVGQHISTDTKYTSVKQFTQQALWNLMVAHDAIIENRVMQTHHANKKRWPGEIYRPGDLVYLSTKNLALPRGRAKKLLPKYIGPYKIVEVHNDTSTVKLELPVELESRRISPTFHSRLIRPHIENNNEIFPKRDVKSHYNFRETDDQEWFIEEIITHR